MIASRRDAFEVHALSTYQNVELLLQQARQFRPAAVAIYQEDAFNGYAHKFREIGVDVYMGLDGILEISRQADYDILVNALVGAIGLKPTLYAIRKGRRIALANKETLVIGGQLVMQRVREHEAELIPIDSEHSAVFQCLVGENYSNIENVILTASGGPFRDLPASEFEHVTVEQALNHPNWDMGPKITIDSATLMNKGLEVIEAHWLFDMPPSKIQVVIHPQSIIHSIVEFRDGSMKAQLGQPDMRIPIQYALSYPERMTANFAPLDFKDLRELTFLNPDFNKFRCLKLAYEAMEHGGSAPAVLNAANEVAVDLFLNHRIRFDQISNIVEDALHHCEKNSFDGVDELLYYDQSTRDYVKERMLGSKNLNVAG